MMNEETLGKIVEKRWPGGSHSCWPGASGWVGSTLMDDGRRLYRAAADAPTVEEVRTMLAAAVCAPELWALVEAGRKWEDNPDGDFDDELRAALARLPEEVGNG